MKIVHGALPKPKTQVLGRYPIRKLKYYITCVFLLKTTIVGLDLEDARGRPA